MLESKKFNQPIFYILTAFGHCSCSSIFSGHSPARDHYRLSLEDRTGTGLFLFVWLLFLNRHNFDLKVYSKQETLWIILPLLSFTIWSGFSVIWAESSAVCASSHAVMGVLSDLLPAHPAGDQSPEPAESFADRHGHDRFDPERHWFCRIFFDRARKFRRRFAPLRQICRSDRRAAAGLDRFGDGQKKPPPRSLSDLRADRLDRHHRIAGRTQFVSGIFAVGVFSRSPVSFHFASSCSDAPPFSRFYSSRSPFFRKYLFPACADPRRSKDYRGGGSNQLSL